MLDVMESAGAAAPAAPWIAVGVLLTVAVLLLAGLVMALAVRRRGPVRPAESPDPSPAPVEDDLPRFLEFPPGSTAAAGSAGGRHVALSAPAPAPTPPAPPVPRGVPTTVCVAAAGLAVVLLAAAAVALMSAADAPGRGGRAGAPTGTGTQRSTEVRMSFEGLVLEQHAVGVTAAYAEVELTEDSDGPVARLTLPTWNCLSAEAPGDPAEAGCVPSRAEYAELRPSALEVTQAGDGLRFGGEFSTSTRTTSGAPEATGRTYRIEVTVAAQDELRSGRWSPAAGVLTVDDRAAESLAGELRLDD